MRLLRSEGKFCKGERCKDKEERKDDTEPTEDSSTDCGRDRYWTNCGRGREGYEVEAEGRGWAGGRGTGLANRK